MNVKLIYVKSSTDNDMQYADQNIKTSSTSIWFIKTCLSDIKFKRLLISLYY